MLHFFIIICRIFYNRVRLVQFPHPPKKNSIKEVFHTSLVRDKPVNLDKPKVKTVQYSTFNLVGQNSTKVCTVHYDFKFISV